MDSLSRRDSEPFVEQSFTLKKDNHGLEVLKKLNALRSESCFTDAILCVGSEEYPCHRNVLAVSSPYFKALFTSDFRESRDARIEFNDVQPSTVRRLIEYAYTGHLEITIDNAQEMLAAGSMFQFPDIMAACCQFLAQHLHPSNCLGIEEFARMHSCEQLEAEAHQFALDNFSAVVEYDEFVQLSVARLLSYLASDLIDIRTEQTVYEAALRWLHHDVDGRQHHLAELMAHVRFATIDAEYIEEHVEHNALIASCPRCLALIHDARRYHEQCGASGAGSGQRRRSMQAETFTPRPSTVAKEVMVLIGGLENINYLMQSSEMYDPTKDKWSPLPDMPQAVSWFAGAALADDVYVTGGIDDNRIVADVWCFASAKRQWRAVCPLLSPRAHHAAASLGDHLYVVGGVGSASMITMETVEVYDAKTDQWTYAGKSPFPRHQSLMVAYGMNRLVEIGGTQCGTVVKTMESYYCDGRTVRHTGEQFVLPDAIQYANIVVLNGLFYIIWEDTKKVISLNPDKQSFHWLADMNYCHKHSGATVLHGKIYVAGGYVDAKPSRIVECYDPNTNTWTIVKNMRQARSCHSCVTIHMC